MKNHTLTMTTRVFGVSCLLGILAMPSGAQDPQPAQQTGPFLAKLLDTSQPLEIADDDDELQKLLKQRMNAAIKEFRERHAGYQSGASQPRELFEAANRMYEAEVSLAATAADRVAVMQKHLTALTEFHAAFETLVTSGLWQPADLQQLEFHRLTLEIDLLKAKREAGN